jgi:ribose transport system permease protein
MPIQEPKLDNKFTTPAPSSSAPQDRKSWQTALLTALQEIARLSVKFGVISILVVLGLIMSFLSPHYLTVTNITNILIQTGTNGLLAAGMTFVILTGNIDLSVGTVLAFSSIIGAKWMASGHPIALGILLALVVGSLCGFLNGICVAWFDLPAFIVTLATMWFLRGLCYVYTDARAVMGLPDGFRWFASGKIGGIPNVVSLLAIVYLLGTFLLTRTKIGLYIYAIGDNEEAARLSGVNVRQYKTLVFVMSGFLSGLGGMVYASRLFSGQPVAGIGYELNAIAAVVIGGTSLSGGIGTLPGTLIGALFISALTNGLIILNVSAFWQQVLMGIVVLAAVFFDHYRKKIGLSVS